MIRGRPQSGQRGPVPNLVRQSRQSAGMFGRYRIAATSDRIIPARIAEPGRKLFCHGMIRSGGMPVPGLLAKRPETGRTCCAHGMCMAAFTHLPMSSRSDRGRRCNRSWRSAASRYRPTAARSRCTGTWISRTEECRSRSGGTPARRRDSGPRWTRTATGAARPREAWRSRWPRWPPRAARSRGSGSSRATWSSRSNAAVLAVLGDVERFPGDAGIFARIPFGLRMPHSMRRLHDFWNVAGRAAPRKWPARVAGFARLAGC